MNVLLVHKSDSGVGGGNIAMNRLHGGLRRAGVQSRILCQVKRSDSAAATAIARSRSVRRAESLLRLATRRVGLNDLHALSSFGVKKMRAVREADVIDFHCLHGGFFNYLALPGIARGIPAVFTLHDMWPFTGHCHNSLDCERWKTGCGRCPYLDTAPAVTRDATRIEWRLKRWAYANSSLTLVVPSTWMAARASESMLGHFPVHRIPHGVDLDTFRPLDSGRCRAQLGIPGGKRVIMTASNDLGARLKGGDLLLSSLRNLPASLKRETVLLQFGKNGSSLRGALGVETFDLGYVTDDREKAIAYSAADVFVQPSRAESFSLVVLESIACGTPVVSFSVGGVTDLVRPGITGYLAEPEDAGALGRFIVQALTDPTGLESMGRMCREVAEEEYSLSLHVDRYIEVYRRVRDRGGAADADAAVSSRQRTREPISAQTAG